MLKRALIAILLAVFSAMLTTSPVAAMLATGGEPCHEVVFAATGHSPVTHHATHGQADHSMGHSAADPKGSGTLAMHCDHGCLVALPGRLQADETMVRAGRVLEDWTVLDRTDLIEPSSILRPPKN